MRTSFAEHLGQLLRKIGPENNRTGYWAQEADILGVHADTYKTWWYGTAEPGAENCALLIARYGEEFGNALLRPYGLVVATSESFDALNDANRVARLEKGLVEAFGVLDGLREDMARPDVDFTPRVVK